ncbi:hypothetical protein VPH35_014599 [Triticum aestivum]|nr:uncharacterized protein LOC123181421 [Triticum aestivum]
MWGLVYSRRKQAVQESTHIVAPPDDSASLNKANIQNTEVRGQVYSHDKRAGQESTHGVSTSHGNARLNSLVYSRRKQAGQGSTHDLGGGVGAPPHNSASLNKGSIQNTEVREDSVVIACVVPDAGDTAFQIHCLRPSAYAAVLRAFYAQSDLLSRAKQECLAGLRNELKISDTEHREYVVKASTNKHIKSLSAWYKGNIGNAEVAKESLDLKCVIRDAGDALFQIHCLERSAYASVLRAFYAQSDLLSWARLLTNLRNELRLSYMEHREVIARVSSNEYIKSLRKFSLVNYSGLMKRTPAFDLHAVVPDKIDKTGQSFTSLVPQSSTPAHMMSPARNICILGISYSTTKGSCFDPDATVPAKKLKSGSGSALAYFKCPPCAEPLPEAVSSVRAESPKYDLLDSSKESPCAMKAGCAVSPMFQEKHNESNAGDVPWCVHKYMEVSRKRGSEVSPVSRSKSLSVITDSAGNTDHGSDIIKILLTCGLVNKVEELFKVKPDPASLQTAKLILKDQEIHLLDALAKLSEASFASKVNQHDVVKGDPLSYDEAPTSSITELRRAETEEETQGAERAGGQAGTVHHRQTLGGGMGQVFPRKRKKREGCVLHYSAPCLV